MSAAAASAGPALAALREAPLDVDEVRRAVDGPAMGGIDLFLGVVRDHNEGRAVTLLEYHAYASMAEREMAAIVREIEAEIPGTRLAVLHRVGSLQVGDLAVVCAAAAPHRDEAFRACRLLIDRIKGRVPIWKREHGPDGPWWVGWEDARCGPEHAHGEHTHGEHAHGEHTHGEHAHGEHAHAHGEHAPGQPPSQE